MLLEIFKPRLKTLAVPAESMYTYRVEFAGHEDFISSVYEEPRLLMQRVLKLANAGVIGGVPFTALYVEERREGKVVDTFQVTVQAFPEVFGELPLPRGENVQN